jgi:hypothetical protein
MGNNLTWRYLMKTILSAIATLALCSIITGCGKALPTQVIASKNITTDTTITYYFKDYPNYVKDTIQIDTYTTVRKRFTFPVDFQFSSLIFYKVYNIEIKKYNINYQNIRTCYGAVTYVDHTIINFDVIDIVSENKILDKSTLIVPFESIINNNSMVIFTFSK